MPLFFHGSEIKRTNAGKYQSTNPASGHAQSGPDYLHQQVHLIPGCTESLLPNKSAKWVFSHNIFYNELHLLAQSVFNEI